MSPFSRVEWRSCDGIADTTLGWMSVVEYGIATIGLVVVFGFYRKHTKPKIVKVIWGFTTLGILNGIIKLRLE